MALLVFLAIACWLIHSLAVLIGATHESGAAISLNVCGGLILSGALDEMDAKVGYQKRYSINQAQFPEHGSLSYQLSVGYLIAEYSQKELHCGAIPS